MSELRARDHKELLSLIDIAYSIQNRAVMFQALCERLEKWIGISSAVWLPIDAQTRQYVFQDHIRFHAPIQPGLLWALYYAPLHPLAQSHHLQRDMEVFKITDAISPSRLAETEYGKDFQPLIPLFYEMPANLRCQGEPIATLSLHRKRRDGDFTERHRTLLAFLLPHLARAVHSCYLRKALIEVDDNGVLVLGPNGEIRLMNDAARRALNGRSVQSIPQPSLSAKPTLFHTENGIYRVSSTPVHHGSSEQMILLEPQPSQRTIAPLLEHWGLTKRQQEITGLVLQGLSNREIADRLFITEQTVKDHLHDVFEHLKIKRRSELTAKVMALS